NCFINMNCTFLDDDIIEIGKNALIAPNVQIYTAFHHINPNERFRENDNNNENDGKNNLNDLEKDNLTKIDEIEKRREKGIPNLDFSKTESAPVKIGDNVWIGGGVIILPGVTIGDNSVIGAGSIVSKSIPSNKLAYGNPCKIIRDI
ncbi:MAG: DapH/DapD/GlmU-related protein, partial [Methanobacteriaceae archaeon]